MKRRSFGKMMIMAATSMIAKNGWSRPLKAAASDIDLPSPTTGLHSVEECLNSRVSTHGGYSGTLNQQILANALWAASRPPLMGVSRFIYAATPDGVYNYDPVSHKLTLHTSGNKLSESKLAFEIGIATDPAGLAEDAGAALHWAHLAIVPFLENTSEKPVCCPKDSGYENANESWNLSANVHLVNCYGKCPLPAVLKPIWLQPHPTIACPRHRLMALQYLRMPCGNRFSEMNSVVKN